jgi:rhamnosyltransferase subunit B
MHVIVSGFGSYGDVLPMVGLGAALRARGHRVQAIVNPYFRAIVEDAGLEMLALGTADEYRALASHPDRWHPHRGLQLVLRWSTSYLREMHRLLVAHSRPRDFVVAAHGLDMASRIFHETHRAPLATVHFAPFALPTLYDTSHFVGASSVSVGPRWWKAAQFWLVDRCAVDPVVAPAINALRAEHRLSPVSRIYSGWNQSPQLVLGMFPDWFGAPQPDWPPHTELLGFPLWDPRPTSGLPDEVEAFLASGDAPLVFTAGSNNAQGQAFFRTAVAVCERLGRRAILSTAYAEQLPASLPPTVLHATFVPYSLLLPRAAALVHPGGVGTCAQGLACGLPQLVMPLAHDQLDNGLRLARLAVGAVVPERKFTPRVIAPVLDRLLTSPYTAACVRHWASKCDGFAALAGACDRLEELAERRPSGLRRARLAG